MAQFIYLLGAFFLLTSTVDALDSNQTFYSSDFTTAGNWKIIEGEWLKGSHTVLILANDLDEVAKTGEKVLLYQMGPEAEITRAQLHDTWEQVIIVNGEMAWLNEDENQSIQHIIQKGDYVNRPPNIPHGPFKAGPEGCLMTVRYYY